MTFGTAEGSRITDKAAIDKIIQTFGSYGYKDLGRYLCCPSFWMSF